MSPSVLCKKETNISLGFRERRFFLTGLKINICNFFSEQLSALNHLRVCGERGPSVFWLIVARKSFSVVECLRCSHCLSSLICQNSGVKMLVSNPSFTPCWPFDFVLAVWVSLFTSKMKISFSSSLSC